MTDDKKRRRIRVAGKYADLNAGQQQAPCLETPIDVSVLAAHPLLAGSNLVAAEEIVKWLCHDCRIAPGLVLEHGLRLFTEPGTGDVGVVYPVREKGAPPVRDMWVQMPGQENSSNLMARIAHRRSRGALWFGEEFLDDDKPAVLVEDALDCLRLKTLGIANVIASMGEPSKEQLRRLKSQVVYLAFDADDTGRRYARRAYHALTRSVINLLRWDDVMKQPREFLRTPRDLTDIAQFRRVFDMRTRLLHD